MLSIDLLRYSWKNEPFSEDENQKLQEVAKHSAVCCSLNLMCFYIYQTSQRLRFLHQDSTCQKQAPLLKVDIMALQEYVAKARGQDKNAQFLI
jgi:hypothetical protein